MTTDDDDDDIDVDSDGDVGHAEAVSHVQKTGADGHPHAPPAPICFMSCVHYATTTTGATTSQTSQSANATNQSWWPLARR